MTIYSPPSNPKSNNAHSAPIPPRMTDDNLGACDFFSLGGWDLCAPRFRTHVRQQNMGCSTSHMTPSSCCLVVGVAAVGDVFCSAHIDVCFSATLHRISWARRRRQRDISHQARRPVGVACLLLERLHLRLVVVVIGVDVVDAWNELRTLAARPFVRTILAAAHRHIRWASVTSTTSLRSVLSTPCVGSPIRLGFSDRVCDFW